MYHVANFAARIHWLPCQASQPHLRPRRYPHYHPQLIHVDICSETTTFSFTHYQHHPSATTNFIDEKPNLRQVITMAKKKKICQTMRNRCFERPGTLLVLDQTETDAQLLLSAEMRNAPTNPYEHHSTASRSETFRRLTSHCLSRFVIASATHFILCVTITKTVMVIILQREDCQQTGCLSPLIDTCTPTQGSCHSTRLPF